MGVTILQKTHKDEKQKSLRRSIIPKISGTSSTIRAEEKNEASKWENQAFVGGGEQLLLRMTALSNMFES